MDKIEAMKVFIRVAETASFTKSADGLGLPRATITAAVQQLEASLGVRLLHRTTRRVQLSQDGVVVLERCRQVVADMEEIETLFQQSPARLSGKLKVDVPSHIGRRLIAPALPDFFLHYPQITLELGASDLALDLIHEGVDCALRVGEHSDSGLVARPLGTVAIINCASPSYIRDYGMPFKTEELSQHWAIHFSSPASGRVSPWTFVEHTVERSLALANRVTVNNIETYIACAQAGLGLIQIPAYDVRDLLASGELVEVLPHARAPAMPVYALYPHRRHLSRRVQAFVDWLEALLEPELSPAGA
jgi:DNA-binding transcriptional LysR family regulator